MKIYKRKYQSKLKRYARDLRKKQSDAEQKIWHYLRARQLNGYKFRRQYPIGEYILDFYCVKKKLAIELDGGQHAENLESDRIRTRNLSNLGITVLRFWNHETLTETDSVLKEISRNLR